MARLPVSIIMNARNGATTIRESIGSALAQTFTDWEMIVWDDFSTDDTAAIVSEFSDPRIRYMLSPIDTPLGKARDLAIREAHGDWLAFLDQDDLWRRDKLERQLALSSDPSIAIIYGRTMMFDPEGNKRDFDHRHEFTALPDGDIFNALFDDSCFIAMSSVLLRRSAVDAIGGIPDNIKVSPDYFLYLNLARHHRAAAIQEVICWYRVHQLNMTKVNQRQIHTECLWMLAQFESDLDPALAKRRRRVHETLFAFQDLLRLGTFARGLRHVVRHGSAGYLLARPFARTFRAVRRRFKKPHARTVTSANDMENLGLDLREQPR